MKNFIDLLKKSPTGFITGIFRSDLCVDDFENLENTHSGDSDKTYAYNAINLIFEKNGILLGRLKIPFTKENYDSGVIRSDPVFDRAEYGGQQGRLNK